MADSPKPDTRFTLEAPLRTPDGGGGAEIAWTQVGTLWGALEARSGREGVSGDRRLSHVTHRITIRRGPTDAHRPTAAQRLVHRGRVFAIHAVAEADAGGAWLTIWAEEGPLS